MSQHVNNYEVISKIEEEMGGGVTHYVLKLLYRGDGTYWGACASGLTQRVSKEFFDSVTIYQKISITLTAV